MIGQRSHGLSRQWPDRTAGGNRWPDLVRAQWRSGRRGGAGHWQAALLPALHTASPRAHLARGLAACHGPRGRSSRGQTKECRTVAFVLYNRALTGPGDRARVRLVACIQRLSVYNCGKCIQRQGFKAATRESRGARPHRGGAGSGTGRAACSQRTNGISPGCAKPEFEVAAESAGPEGPRVWWIFPLRAARGMDGVGQRSGQWGKHTPAGRRCEAPLPLLRHDRGEVLPATAGPARRIGAVRQ